MKDPASLSSTHVDEDTDSLTELYNENQLLGRLVQDMQAKLSQKDIELKRLFEENRGLRSQLDGVQSHLQELLEENDSLANANASLAEDNDRAHAQHRAKDQLEQVVVDLNLRLQQKGGLVAELRERCGQLEEELERLRSGMVTAEHVSQQLSRVEALYRSRLEAVKEDCRGRLEEQQAAARVRLLEAQAAAGQMAERVKRAALREVQRVEGGLESKVLDQLRVLDQLAKRCRALEARVADMRPLAAAAAAARSRARELERRLAEAEEAAAEAVRKCRCCCGCGARSGHQDASDTRGAAVLELTRSADLQARLASLRGELAAQVQVASQLHVDLAAVQQGRVVAEERLEDVETLCRELRTENGDLRTQLLALSTPGVLTTTSGGDDAGAAMFAGGCDDALVNRRQREVGAHAAALKAAEADAAARALLQAARRGQVAASRALLGQLRRMQALEAMRLQDLQEIHQLERRLAEALQKCSADGV